MEEYCTALTDFLDRFDVSGQETFSKKCRIYGNIATSIQVVALIVQASYDTVTINVSRNQVDAPSFDLGKGERNKSPHPKKCRKHKINTKRKRKRKMAIDK